MTNDRLSSISLFFLHRNHGRFSDVRAWLRSFGVVASDVTVKRDLSALTANGRLAVHGAGPTTSYSLTTTGRLFAEVDAHSYCANEPDRRFGSDTYNFDLINQAPKILLTPDECSRVSEATRSYVARLHDVTPTIHRKELERFVIELSWKSSKIEGNTYNLLDTERLLRDGIMAPQHTRGEAIMILNHKAAFLEVANNRDAYHDLTKAGLLQLHSLLTKDQGVSPDLRKTLVGITGSKYRPLDNRYQIEEAVEALVKAVARLETPAEKALLTLLGISYIQPFEDGNKRTGRLMANAILLANGHAPLSYRSVSEEEYREAILVFYELNSLLPFKRLFIDQYEFAARNYAVS